MAIPASQTWFFPFPRSTTCESRAKTLSSRIDWQRWPIYMNGFSIAVHRIESSDFRRTESQICSSMADEDKSQSQEMSTLLSTQICSQIASVFSNPTHPHPPPLDLLVAELAAVSRRKSRVFLYGVGREGLMLKALCMRLFHLGLSSHLVFDMTTPPISSSDLLIASAGPGGFSTVDAICSVAKSAGARVLLITAQPETGACVKHATAVCYVPAQTMADDHGGGGAAAAPEAVRLLLPMGSLYEGAIFVLFEMVVYRLGEVLNQSREIIRSRHTNLE